MPDTDLRATLSRRLAGRGYRLTGPRRAVMAVLAQHREPMTVAAIHEAVGASRANLVSVYRAVNLLAETGLLRVTDTTNSRRRYELNEEFTGHHHHLVCRLCGRIKDLRGCLLADDVLARVAARVRHAHRFRVTEHELSLFGVCGDCER